MTLDQNKHKKTDTTAAEKSIGAVVGGFVLELVKIFVVALVIIIPLRMFVAEPFIVSGNSMLPNFYHKEYLIVDKLSYRLHEVNRGDVIIFKYPKDTSQFFIKRVVGLPGDRLEVRDGGVYVYNNDHPQGSRLSEPYLDNQNITFGRSDAVTLGSDEFFVLGDNRQASSDSRAWGIMPRSDLVGRAWVRLFPLGDFGPIRFPAPQL